MLNNLLQMPVKLHQKNNSKTAEATGDFTRNKIASKILKIYIYIYIYLYIRQKTINNSCGTPKIKLNLRLQC